jgi:hypothetical protein
VRLVGPRGCVIDTATYAHIWRRVPLSPCIVPPWELAS